MSIISNLRSGLPQSRPLLQAGQSVGRAAAKVAAPFGIVRNPLAQPPASKDTLRVMSYNAWLGGKDYPNLKRNIQKSGADVVGLQEITRENAEKLAKELDMHLAYYDRPDVAGKAILSRYPIKSGKHVGYSVTLGDRLGAFFDQVKSGKGSLSDRLKRVEPLESRGMLISTIEAGGKKIALIDTHLSLGVSAFNAKQLQELDVQAKKLREQGYEVVMMGDFNTNFNIRASKGGKGFVDGTDTVEEYRQRYGKGAGNVEYPEDQKALNRLQEDFQPFWEADKRAVIDKQGNKTTPEEALTELKGTSKESARYAELVDIADGHSHLGADKRFDNILSSLPVKEAWIDQGAKGSDHQPVFAELSLE